MNKHLSVKEILALAINKEIESQALYADLCRRVKSAAAKEAFLELAWQERRHQLLLEKYASGRLKAGVLALEQPLDYKITEHFERPALSPGMELKDVFLFAAEREKASHEFYLCLAELHPAGRVRNLLEGLAAQELDHKSKVEAFYTEVAFPQTDGG